MLEPLKRMRFNSHAGNHEAGSSDVGIDNTEEWEAMTEAELLLSPGKDLVLPRSGNARVLASAISSLTGVAPGHGVLQLDTRGQGCDPVGVVCASGGTASAV